MNCDQAFDRLTSPGADGDAALERHLRGCPRCRDMQETLAPAMEWLASADEFTSEPSAEAAQSPPFLTDEALQVAERAAHRLGRNRATQPPARVATAPKNRGSWLAVAGLAAICLFAVVIPLSTNESGPRSAEQRFHSVGTKCLWQLQGDDQLLPNGNAKQVVATCIACHLPVP